MRGDDHGPGVAPLARVPRVPNGNRGHGCALTFGGQPDHFVPVLQVVWIAPGLLSKALLQADRRRQCRSAGYRPACGAFRLAFIPDDDPVVLDLLAPVDAGLLERIENELPAFHALRRRGIEDDGM